MNKPAAKVLLILLFASMFLVFNPVNAETSVSGSITVDTTWTKNNSPYTVTEKTLIAEGKTLTIEPGVTVNIDNSAYLQVKGMLVARGSANEKIYFNGGQIRFTQVSCIDWNEETGYGCIIENAEINSNVDKAIYIIENSIKLNANTINAKIYSSYGGPIITNNIIIGGIVVDGGATIISNNKITKNGLDFGYGDFLDALVTKNSISDIGVSGINVNTGNASNQGDFSLRIEKNLIKNCETGINVGAMISPTIKYNTITNNKGGILLLNYPGSTIIAENSIINCEQYSLSLSQWIATDISVPNNWWGTTNIQEIEKTIWDSDHNFDVGTVTFEPILTQPSSLAPTEASDTTPTITSTPTELPTNNPKSSSSQTPQPTTPSGGMLPTGSPVHTSDNQMQGYIITASEVALAGLAGGWIAIMVMLIVRRRKK